MKIQRCHRNKNKKPILEIAIKYFCNKVLFFSTFDQINTALMSRKASIKNLIDPKLLNGSVPIIVLVNTLY